MPSRFSVDRQWCLPFRIAESIPHAVAFFGGGAPEGVRNPNPSMELEHLFTLNWRALEFAVTCFVSSRFETVLERRGKLRDAGDDCIGMVMHSNLGGPDPSNSPSRYPACTLELGLPTAESGDSIELPWSHNKIGGIALAMEFESLEAIRLADERSLQHLVQLCFPGGEDLPLRGDWPLGQDDLHLFVDRDSGAFSYLIGR